MKFKFKHFLYPALAVISVSTITTSVGLFAINNTNIKNQAIELNNQIANQEQVSKSNDLNNNDVSQDSSSSKIKANDSETTLGLKTTTMPRVEENGVLPFTELNRDNVYPYYFSSDYGYKTSFDIEGFINKNIDRFFRNPGQAKVVKNSIEITNIDNIDNNYMMDIGPTVSLSFRIINYLYEGITVNHESGIYSFIISGFKRVQPPKDTTATPELYDKYHYATFFEPKIISSSKNQLASQVANDLLQAQEANGGHLTPEVMQKYFYYGAIPNDSEVKVENILPNNQDGSLQVTLSATTFFSSLSAKQCEYNYIKDAPQYYNIIFPEGTFFNSFSYISSHNISLRDINSSPSYTINDLKAEIEKSNADKKDTTNVTTLKSLMAKAVLLNGIKDSRYTYKDIDLSNVKFEIDQQSGMLILNDVGINNYISVNSIGLKKTFFKIVSTPSSQPVAVKNDNYPSFLNKDEITKKLQNDVNSYKTFTQQTFIQSFVTVYNIDTSKIYVKQCNVKDSTNEAYDLDITFIFANWPEGANTIDKQFTFSYKLYSKPGSETRLSQNKMNFDKTLTINYNGNPKYTITNPYPFQVLSDKKFVQKIIYDNIENKPGPIDSNGNVNVNFKPEDIIIDNSQQKLSTTPNETGVLSVPVFVTKKLELNPETNKLEYKENGKFPLGTFEFTGLNFTGAETTVSLNDQYYDIATKFKPSEFIDAFNSSSDTQKRDYLSKLISFNSYGFIDSQGNVLPNFQDYVFDLSNIQMEPNDQEGKLVLTFTYNTPFVLGSNNINVVTSQSKTETLTFLFFNNLPSPTDLANSVYDDNTLFEKYTALETYYLMSTSEPKYKPLKDEIINAIKDNLLNNNWFYFLPEGFTKDNIVDIRVEDYNVNPYNQEFDNGQTRKWPYITLRVFINKHVGNGDKPVIDLACDYYANFKLIETTRINGSDCIVPNVSNVIPSNWKPNETELKKALEDIIYQEYQKNNETNRILGTTIYPPDRSRARVLRREDIKVKGTPVFDDMYGTITANVTLVNYWEVRDGNAKFYDYVEYTPPTQIIFKGFNNKGLTVLPSNGQYSIEKVTTIANHYPSEIVNSNDPNAQGLTSYKIKDLILNGYNQNGVVFEPLITGNKESLTPDDIVFTNDLNFNNMTFVAEPNDLEGSLRIIAKMKRMYYKDYEGNIAGPDIDKSQVSESSLTFDITLTNFLKRKPTSYENVVDLSKKPGFENKTVWDVTDEELKNMIVINDAPQVPQGQYNFEIIPNSIKRNATTGVIELSFKYTNYYNPENGIQVKGNDIQLPSAGPHVVRFINLLSVEPTKFVDANTIKFDGIKYPTLTNVYPQQLEYYINNPNAATDEVKAVINDLKNFIFNDVIISGKLNLSPADITIKAISHNNLNGELKLEISLNKYWDSNSKFQTNNEAGFKPLTKTITISKFKTATKTIFIDGIEVYAPDQFRIYFAPKFNSELNSKWINDPNSPELKIIKDVIFKEAVDGYKEHLDSSSVNVLRSELDPEDKTRVKIFYKLNNYWDNDGNYSTTPTPEEHSLIFYGFNNNKATQIMPGPFNIVDRVYNEYGDKFGAAVDSSPTEFLPNTLVQSKTASQWMKEVVAANGSVERQIVMFILYNSASMGIINNPPEQLKEKNPDVTTADGRKVIEVLNPQADDKAGTIKFTVVLNARVNNEGLEEDIPVGAEPLKKEVTIEGFMKVGATNFTEDTSISITKNSDLYDYVYNNNLLADKVTADAGKIKPSAIEPWVKQLLFDFGVTGYKPTISPDPSMNLSKDNIKIISISKQDKFAGTIEVQFTLDKWYDESGTLQNTLKTPPKTITITDFPKPISAAGPTKFYEGEIAISNAGNTQWLDENGDPIYYATVLEKGSENPPLTLEEARAMLEKWAWSALISGNVEDLNKDNNLKIDYIFFDRSNGKVEISYMLKRYWSASGSIIENTSHISYKVTITGFKHVSETSLVIKNVDLNGRDENYTWPSYAKGGIDSQNPDKDIMSASEMLITIGSSTPDQIKDDEILRKNFTYYVNQFVKLNVYKLYLNLPGSGANSIFKPDLKDVDMKTQVEISDKIFDVKDGKISMDINLKCYVDSNRQLKGPDAHDPLTGQITFSGFVVQNATALKATNIVIDMSKQNNGVEWSSPIAENETYNQTITAYSKLETIFVKKQPDTNNEETVDIYNWNQSEAANLANDLNKVAKENEVPQINFYAETIKKWILQNNIWNGSKTTLSDIIIDDKHQNISNAYGEISNIKFIVTRGYIKDEKTGLIHEGKINLTGTIKIVGFVDQENEHHVNKVIMPIAIGIVSLIFVCILIVIIILIYRRRNDIEYNK